MWLLMLACGTGETPKPPPPASSVTITPVADAAPAPSRRTYVVELGSSRKRLAVFAQRVKARPSAWEAWLDQAETHLTLQRLRGGIEDQLAARDAYERAVEFAPEGNSRLRRFGAKLLGTEHRFAEAIAQLEGLDTPADRVQRASMRFQLGHYTTSVAALEVEVDAMQRPHPAVLGSLGTCLWKLGRFEEAEALVVRAMRAYHGRDQWVVAWHHLMLGLMDLDREDLEAAEAHYAAAEQALPGWWLVREHQAEIFLAKGDAAAALPIYEAVVEETGSPELMGALADCLDALGRAEQATAWRAKALAGFEAQLVQAPSSAGGHALDFFLTHAPERALALAEANAALRPNGEAKLQLAVALDQAGRSEEAAASRKEVAVSGWWMP